MANTLTNLIPDIYEALDVVSRELTGAISAVSMDNSLDRVALNDTIRIPITQAQSAANNTPGATPPDTGDQTIDNATMTIDNSKHVAIRWNGEQQKGYKLNGTYTSIFSQQIAQGMRTIVNLMEVDIMSEYIRASRAYGTAGTTPFATDISDAAQLKKILDDNGAPMGDRHIILGTTAGVNLRALTQLTSANTAGSTDALRRGVLLDLFGFAIRESAGVQSHTAGTATGFDANGGEPVGEVTIVVDGSDSGTILAGDVVSWVGDTNKYIVVSSTASGAAAGNIVINKPGLVQTLATTVEGSLGSAYTANMAWQRSAIQMATRMPQTPADGDQATDAVQVTDPNTGLSFEVAYYPQYLQGSYHVRLAWGVKLIKPEHTAILLG